MDPQQPRPPLVPTPGMSGLRLGAILAFAGAVLLIIVMVPFMSTTLRTGSDGNCGTVWASSDTWTYDSSYAGADSYFSDRPLTQSGIEADTQAAVNGMLADLKHGATVYDACTVLHEDRETLLWSLGGSALVLAAAGVGFLLTERYRSAS